MSYKNNKEKLEWKLKFFKSYIEKCPDEKMRKDAEYLYEFYRKKYKVYFNEEYENDKS